MISKVSIPCTRDGNDYSTPGHKISAPRRVLTAHPNWGGYQTWTFPDSGVAHEQQSYLTCLPGPRRTGMVMLAQRHRDQGVAGSLTRDLLPSVTEVRSHPTGGYRQSYGDSITPSNWLSPKLQNL